MCCLEGKECATTYSYLQVGHLLAEVDDGEDGADVHGHGLGELLVELDGGGTVEHDAHLRHQAPAQNNIRLDVKICKKRI
jgi:hypothetical protein